MATAKDRAQASAGESGEGGDKRFADRGLSFVGGAQRGGAHDVVIDPIVREAGEHPFDILTIPGGTEIG